MIGLPILTYHSLDESGSVLSVHPELFARQMTAVAECGFRGVSLAEAVRRREADGDWPERTVALTFDDGYANLHRHARPVLERVGFGATVFVVTDHVGGHNDWEEPPPRLGRQAVLGWPQLLELASCGWEIGSHTRSHPDLRRLGRQQLEAELDGSVQEIERQLGQPVETFAYPFGFTSPLATAVVAERFRAACTTVLGRTAGEPACSLPRVDMYYLRETANIPRLLAGELDRYLSVRRLGRRLRATLLALARRSG